MIPYRNYSWIYKANYWQVAGGKFHWHNPQTNRVEDFNPNQVQGPHAEVSEPRKASADDLRGEWWLDDSGQSTFADGDIGDANHEMVAMESALGISFENPDEDMPEMVPHEKLSNEAVAWLRDQGVDEAAIDHFKRGKDPRDYAMHKMGWVRVKDNMFQAASFNDNSLKNIQNFIYENMEHPEEAEGEVMVEEMATNNVYELPIKYLVMEQATAEGLKKFADRRSGVVREEPKEDTKHTEGVAQGVDSPAFKSWFGNSKAVDKDGKPLVLYHGTGKNFTVFDHSKAGREGTLDAKEGFFFTDSKDAADEWTWSNGEKTGKIVPAYLKMENPLRVKGNPEHYDPSINSKAIKMAKEGGYDGIIFENQASLSGKSNHYVIFDSKQVKSATGNKGTFSPDSPDINE